MQIFVSQFCFSCLKLNDRKPGVCVRKFKSVRGIMLVCFSTMFILYRTFVIKKFNIVCSFNVKNNDMFPCLHTIRLSYTILKYCSAFPN